MSLNIFQAGKATATAVRMWMNVWQIMEAALSLPWFSVWILWVLSTVGPALQVRYKYTIMMFDRNSLDTAVTNIPLDEFAVIANSENLFWMHFNLEIKSLNLRWSSCICVGYEGDGRTCTQSDICSSNNGGCYPLASCSSNPGRTCINYILKKLLFFAQYYLLNGTVIFIINKTNFSIDVQFKDQNVQRKRYHLVLCPCFLQIDEQVQASLFAPAQQDTLAMVMAQQVAPK